VPSDGGGVPVVVVVVVMVVVEREAGMENRGLA
jgi:hypothetical protein